MKRREFIKTGLLTTVAAGVLNDSARGDSLAHVEGGRSCRVVQSGTFFELESPAFGFSVDAANGLSARCWKNKLSGLSVPLVSDSEIEVDLDAAEERIQIQGWKG